MSKLLQITKSTGCPCGFEMLNVRCPGTKSYERSLTDFQSPEVVKEAQENFAASSGVTPLPALPVRPPTRPEAKRTGRPGRVPRRILAADRIFTPDVSDVSSSMMQSECLSPLEDTHNVSTVLTIPSDESSAAPITPPPAVSPPRQRRVTISSVSPDNSVNMMVDVESQSSPLRHEKAKSASHLNRLVRPITPLDMLEKELEKGGIIRNAIPPL